MTDTVIVTETNTVLSVIGSEPQVIVADPQVETVAVSTTDTVLAVQDASPSLAISDQTDVLTVVQELFQTVEIVAQGPQGPPGSAGAWGSITGTLSAQTDLQNALNAKADASALSGYALVSRLISTGAGLAGGGSLAADRTLVFDTAWGDARYVQPAALAAYALAARLISPGTGLTGGGSLAADRTLAFDTTWGDARYVQPAALSSYAPTTRAINTTAPLAGGGDLTANRTLSINNNGITDALLRQGAATSVVGRSLGSTGNVADIAATADGQFLRRSAGALTWGVLVGSDITGALGFTPYNATNPAGYITSVADDTTTQRVQVALAGALVGTRRRLNFIQGANVTLSVVDDTVNNEVDVTIAATGGGGGGTPGGSSGQVQWNNASALAGISGVTTNGTNLTALGLEGNLTFVGNGRRIFGDFTTATVADRPMFQTNVTDGATGVNAIPNGTGGLAAWAALNSSNPAQSAVAVLQCDAAQASISSTRTGTAAPLPLDFYTHNGTTTVRAMRIFGNQNVRVGSGTTDPGIRFLVEGAGAFGSFTPAAWGAPYLGSFVEVGRAGSAIYSNTAVSQFGFSQNLFYNGTAWTHAATGLGALIAITDGAYDVYTTTSNSGPAALVLRQRIHANGNVNFGPATADPGVRLQVEGNVSISGASRRVIIGSANDGTATLFQGSTLNSSTIFGAVPNGTSTVGGIRVYGASSGTDTTFAQIAIDGAAGFASVDSSHNGAGGSSLPLRFRMTTSGSVLTRATLFNNGNFNIGPTLTDPNVMLRVEGSVRFNPPAGTLVGLNVPSSSWMNTTSGIEIGRAGNAIVSYNTGPAVQISSNTFFNGTSWVYANTGVAGVLNVNGGTLDWLNAPSGTGGTNLTLTSRFSVNANGNATIGAPTAGNALSLFSGALFSPGTNPTGAALRVQGSFGGGIVIEDTAFWGVWADGSGANLRIGSSPNISTGFTTRATLTNAGSFTTANYFATGATGYRHTDGGTGAFFELRARDAGGGYRPTSLYVSNDGSAAGLRFDFSSGGNLTAWPQSNFLGFEAISGTSGIPAVTLHKSGNYAARMYLNGSNRFSFGSYSAAEDVFQIDFGGTTFLRGTGPTHWWWDTDHRTFGIHVNSNLAYFMRGGVNDPNWTTVTDRYGNLRWPMVMDLNSGNMEMGNDLRTGGKFFGRYAGNGLAAVILSTVGPSGGADGDLWLRY